MGKFDSKASLYFDVAVKKKKEIKEKNMWKRKELQGKKRINEIPISEYAAFTGSNLISNVSDLTDPLHPLIVA